MHQILTLFNPFSLEVYLRLLVPSQSTWNWLNGPWLFCEDSESVAAATVDYTESVRDNWDVFTWSSTYDFSTLRWWESNTHSAKTILWILIFFWASHTHSTILSYDAGQQQLPVSLAIMKANHQYNYNHYVAIYPFCFSLSVQYSVNYMRYSMLHYKMGFASDDFAQIQANVNILSMFKESYDIQ